MLQRVLALLMCLVLLPALAIGEVLDTEAVHSVVEGLFQAAAGVEDQAEARLRKGMNTKEIASREEELAAYRSAVRPWLVAALQSEDNKADELAIAYQTMQTNEIGQGFLQLLEIMGSTTQEEQLLLCRVAFEQWMDEVDHTALRIINDDYICWIHLPGTLIDYPVVQCDNNKTYLNRLFDGKRNASGTLFVDYRNLPDFRDPNTLIYGHHMRNGTMFGTLTAYDKAGYAAAHPYLLIMAPTGLMLVELFAGYVTSSDDHCYDIAISDAADLLAFVEVAREKSSFAVPLEVAAGDRLVTLSTCAYAFENARYILIGKIETLWEQTESLQ